MNLSTLTSSDLKYISGLLERKESLLEQIQEIEAELASYEASPKRGTRSGRSSGGNSVSNSQETLVEEKAESVISGGRARRGQLKETILTILKDAGRDGISIQDISAKAGVKALNVSAWLAATGKKLGTIEKAERGIYRLKG